jgi:hypothetical protein
MCNKKEKHIENRRSFLKKALYQTPVLYCLGSLSLTEGLHADGTGGPSGPPGGSGGPFGKRVGKRTLQKRKQLRY